MEVELRADEGAQRQMLEVHLLLAFAIKQTHLPAHVLQVSNPENPYHGQTCCTDAQQYSQQVPRISANSHA
jgi:hypothetical protein